MYNIIYIYNLNTINSHFLIFFNSLKNFVRILLGIKCKSSMFFFKKKLFEAIFFSMIHLF